MAAPGCPDTLLIGQGGGRLDKARQAKVRPDGKRLGRFGVAVEAR